NLLGHECELGMATHTEDRTPQEIRERANAFFAQMAKPQRS
ncbi:MAG: hypothetical protein HW409_1254, partial [candidate division NC10 bacterium]|nr:hypothetical protein [candidate division NC10 bacterium]